MGKVSSAFSSAPVILFLCILFLFVSVYFTYNISVLLLSHISPNFLKCNGDIKINL